MSVRRFKAGNTDLADSNEMDGTITDIHDGDFGLLQHKLQQIDSKCGVVQSLKSIQQETTSATVHEQTC